MRSTGRSSAISEIEDKARSRNRYGKDHGEYFAQLAFEAYLCHLQGGFQGQAIFPDGAGMLLCCTALRFAVAKNAFIQLEYRTLTLYQRGVIPAHFALCSWPLTKTWLSLRMS